MRMKIKVKWADNGEQNLRMKQETVLDKIRSEIENIDLLAEYTRGDIKRMALAIIDKYKAESKEEK